MDINQTTSFLNDTLNAVKNGQLVPAAFQRSYAWSRDDVEALWTSMLNGWPIGSILLWQPPHGTDIARAGRLRLGPIQPPADRWTTMILDGQNRLATMAWSMRSASESRPDDVLLSAAERQTWDPSATLVCDCDSRSVRFVPTEEADSPRRLPIATLTDFKSLSRFLRNNYGDGGLADNDLDWIEDVTKRFRSAVFAVTKLQNATAAEAVHAYSHIARVGQPVTVQDVEAALSWLDNDERTMLPQRTP